MLAYNPVRTSNQLHDACSRHMQLGRLIMSRPTLLFSAAILFAVSAVPASTIALAATPQQDSTNPAKSTPASQDHAKNLYTRDCALCHGEDGSGKTDLAKDMKLTLLDWTDPKSLANRSDKELFHAIRVGKDSMPAEEEGRAKDTEVWNLILYIRGFAKGPATPAAAPAPAPAPPADASKPGN
jgi:mono/diheme cytochrome c family protein